MSRYINFSGFGFFELRHLARELGINSPTRYTKPQLINKIEAALTQIYNEYKIAETKTETLAEGFSKPNNIDLPITLSV